MASSDAEELLIIGKIDNHESNPFYGLDQNDEAQYFLGRNNKGLAPKKK